MPLRKKYLPLPSPVVATYTTTDAIQQKGILEFYEKSVNWNDNTPPDGSSILVKCSRPWIYRPDIDKQAENDSYG